MRQVLYHLVMIFGAKILKLISAINVLVAQATQNLAKFLSKEQAEYYEVLLPQLQTLNEFQIIQASLQTRDAALDQEEWTEEQYEYLSHLMSSLHDIHGWTKEDVDTHMEMLVTSGPEGYEYEPSEDDE